MVNATPRPLYRRERDPLPCTGGWMETEPVWTGEENLPRTGIRSPDCPARNKSLYRLSYPSPPPFQENIRTKPECGQVSSCHNLFNYLYINHRGNRDSSVRVVTRRQAGRPKNYSSNFGTSKSVIRSPNPQDWLWGPHSYTFHSYQGLFLHTET